MILFEDVATRAKNGRIVAKIKDFFFIFGPRACLVVEIYAIKGPFTQ